MKDTTYAGHCKLAIDGGASKIVIGSSKVEESGGRNGLRQKVKRTAKL